MSPRVTFWALAAAVAVASSCGGNEEATPAGPRPLDRSIDTAFSAAANGRIVVAQVNGHPVYADCVSTQASAHNLDAPAALEECIAFELLAQEAKAKGYLDHPDVQRVRQRELVRALIDADYPLQSAAGIPLEDVRTAWEQGIERVFNHAEGRSIALCRVNVPNNADEATTARAKALSNEVHAVLSAAPVVDAELMFETCRSLGETHPEFKLIAAPYTSDRHGYADSLTRPLFAMTRIGQLSRPIRSPQGWDIMVLTKIIPEVHTSFEDAIPEIQRRMFTEKSLEEYRQSKFDIWARGHESRASVATFADRIPNSPL